MVAEVLPVRPAEARSPRQVREKQRQLRLLVREMLGGEGLLLVAGGFSVCALRAGAEICSVRRRQGCRRAPSAPATR